MKTGDKAPLFTLNDGDGNKWSLKDHLGSVVALLFYPGDNTPVCTKQMCSVRDNWSKYEEQGAVVVGISTDSVESHRGFKEKHDLPLTLLADDKGEVVKLYDVKSWIPGKSSRAVIVIDRTGRIAYRDIQSLGIFMPKDSDIIEAIRSAG